MDNYPIHLAGMFLDCMYMYKKYKLHTERTHSEGLNPGPSYSEATVLHQNVGASALP